MSNHASPGPGDAPADARFVEQTMAGDRRAFDELIRRYQRKAMAVAYRLLGNADDAAEVTQDAFVKAYSSLGTLENAERFGPWLMRIVSNLSLNKRRGRRKNVQLPTDDLLGGDASSPADVGPASIQTGRADDPQTRLAGRELGERLLQALQELPEKQRLAITLFTIEQMPQKDVAETLGCSVEAVKWHVFQGRKKLKEILKDLL